jgi:hypothetical protein
MECKIHTNAKEMVCSRCADMMCALCAEFIDGNWYCPDCAISERRIAAGLNYGRLVAAGYGEPPFSEEPAEISQREY